MPSGAPLPTGLFIAGTDTGVGKTRITAGLVRAMSAAGRRAIGMKPVATGIAVSADTRENDEENGNFGDDIAIIRASSSIIAPISIMNPYRFVPPVSPHIAAARAGANIDIASILNCFTDLAQRADVVIVEGTGGWLTPIGTEQTMADIAVQLGLPVVLVVGLRLGCLNHALLTAAAIHGSGCRLEGWIGNRVDPDFLEPEANVAALSARLGTPPLALLPYSPDDSLQEASAAIGAALRPLATLATAPARPPASVPAGGGLVRDT